MLTGKRWVKKSPIDAGLFMSLVHEASLRDPYLPAPPDAVGRVNVVYMAANPLLLAHWEGSGHLFSGVQAAGADIWSFPV